MQFVRLLQNDIPRLLVVNLWATWCLPCTTELPLLEAAAAKYPAINFVFVNVNEIRDSAVVARFVQEKNLQTPTFHLWTSDPARALSLIVPAWPNTIPLTLVIEPGGAERARFVGAVQGPALAAALEAG